MSIKRALISVYDKTAITEFASALACMGVEILSTGGTAEVLKTSGIKVTDVSEYTGFPEIMDGRVKTLHPKIHAGILARRDKKEDVEILKKNGIKGIDMVVVNLYPFESEKTIENIDIGGPTLLRAVAKNHKYVTALILPEDYGIVLKEMRKNGGDTTAKTREKL